MVAAPRGGARVGSRGPRKTRRATVGGADCSCGQLQAPTQARDKGQWLAVARGSCKLWELEARATGQQEVKSGHQSSLGFSSATGWLLGGLEASVTHRWPFGWPVGAPACTLASRRRS